MKKYFYIMAASIAALVSCNKDTSVPEQDPSKEEKCTFCVSAIADSTKTSLGENGTTVIWDEGEPIALWDARTSGQGISFKMVSITSTKVAAEFAGEVPGGTTDYYVLAPYDGNAVFNKDNSTITSTIAAEQYMRNGSFESGKSLSFGIGKREPKQTEGDGVTFSNVCSIIKFKIPAYVQATSVVISANDKGDLAGTAVISVSEQKITSVSGSKTVTVYSNDVSSGNDTYYAVVAPRTYENGLTFQVQTSGGNSYSCKTTKNIPATGGVIYNIGSLGLKLDGKIEPTVSIEHNYSGGLLTGSTAVLTNEVAPELASMVKSWTITLKKGGVDYATINSASGTMTNVSGKPYLPQGSYDLEVKYTPQSGSERTLNFTNKGTSPAPNNVNATISHNYSGGVLTGSTAKLGDGTATSATEGLTYTLKKGNTAYATYVTTSAGGVMTNVSGKPYIPQGDYDLEISQTGDNLTFTSAGTSPAPNKVTANISHNYSNGVLTGSTAKLGDGSVTAATEGLTYTLKKGNTAYATYVTTSAGGVMNNVSGKPYLPQGSYDLEISQTGDKVSFTEVGNSSEPTFSVSVAGHSSYNTYTTSGAGAANEEDGSSVIGRTATLNGIADAVLNQVGYTVRSYIDGENEVSSTTSKTTASTNTTVSWAQHTISGSATFDNKTVSSNIIVHVTGLPYNKENLGSGKLKSDWNLTGESQWQNTYFEIRKGGKATFKGFYVPDNINTKFSYRVKSLTLTRWTRTTTIIYFGGIKVLEDENTDNDYKEYKDTYEGLLSKTENTFYVQSNGSSSSWVSSRSQGFEFQVLYR